MVHLSLVSRLSPERWKLFLLASFQMAIKVLLETYLTAIITIGHTIIVKPLILFVKLIKLLLFLNVRQ